MFRLKHCGHNPVKEMNSMSKINQNVTMDKKSKNTIRNIIYASLIACTVLLGAILIAVNVNSNPQSTTNNATIAVNTNTTTFVAPMENASVVKDFSNKELQYNNTLKQWEIHKALDIASDTSSSVLAIANGTVTNVYNNYLEGGVIEITHENGIKSVYKSVNDVSVKLGDYVKGGDIIASVSTNMARENATGAHLHFEMYKNEISINPNDYIDFSNK